MVVEELIVQLASFDLSSTTEKSKDKGGNALQALRTHVNKVQLDVSNAGSSVTELKKNAKKHARGLLKIAQTGLRNTTGGAELLRLSSDAIRSLLPLYPFAGTADLTTEKLCYQAIARSVDLGEFLLGLSTTAYLQACLRQRAGSAQGQSPSSTSSSADNAACTPHLPLSLLLDADESGGGTLQLRSFDSPAASDSIEAVKLVSGASLNACRCCLEMGSREALGLIAGGLGRSAGLWIDRVGELGEAAKAESYRDHLFKLLWRSCSALERPALRAQAGQCLEGRRTALQLLTRQHSTWNVSVFVAHAHRAAVSLERLGGNADRTSSVSCAVELSLFCQNALYSREGERWPAEDEKGHRIRAGFQPGWVEWLLYIAALHEKTKGFSETQRLLQLAYEYVRRCSKRGASEEGKQVESESESAVCAVYSGMLKVQAATTMAAHSTPLYEKKSVSAVATAPRAGRRPAKPKGRAGRMGSDVSSSALGVHANISRALEHFETANDSLNVFSFSSGSRLHKNAEPEAEASALVVAFAKAWKWAQKLCGLTAAWVEKQKDMCAVDDGGLGLTEWSALNERGLRVLGDLSRNFATLGRCAPKELLGKMPSAQVLVEMSFDSYIRAALVHLGILSSATQAVQAQHGPDGDGDCSDEGSACHCLLAAEVLCENECDVLTSQHAKRVGAGWYGLGQALIDGGKLRAGLDALVRGCQLLEKWVQTESCGHSTADADDARAFHSALLRSAQLDLRLSKLSKALMELGEYGPAAVATARALSFCPELWTMSHDGHLVSSTGAQALVERYVVCLCRDAEAPMRKSGEKDGAPGDDGNNGPAGGKSVLAAVGKLATYLTDAGGSPTKTRSFGATRQEMAAHLRRRGLPAAGITWVLLAECRAYRAHLSSHAAESPQGVARHHSVALQLCVDGHRRATEAILAMCDLGLRNGDACEWEAHAHFLSAWFEHELFLMGFAAKKGLEVGELALTALANLPSGIQHAVRGFDATSKPHSQQRQSAGIMAGACACVRAVLLRDLAEPGDSVRDAMRCALDLLGDSLKASDERAGGPREVVLAPADAPSIVSCLEVLEAHFSLHRDIRRSVRSAETRVLLTGCRQAEGELAGVSTESIVMASTLSSIGAAYYQAGIPVLPSIFCSAAEDELMERDERETGARENNAFALVEYRAAQASTATLRGLCMAAYNKNVFEAERKIVQARHELSLEGSIECSETAAYLECMAGLGISWLYERRGRLAEAMGELRQVLRLCHAWAFHGSPLSESDKQIVSLSARKGTSVHDESMGVQVSAARSSLPEEGVGEESGDVEETLQNGRSGDTPRQAGGMALSSRWLPIYLEGLSRMGRLWRARGFASKASGYLRQGCVVGENLRAASFVRCSLVEEVEVAVQMHRFDRANRLLEACQALLEEERRDAVVAEMTTRSTVGCPDCSRLVALDSANASTAAPVMNKGRTSRKGSRNAVAKGKATLSEITLVPDQGICVSCRDCALNKAELLVSESDILRRQGDFLGARAACERGQTTLAPLMEAAGRGFEIDCSMSFEHAALASGLENVHGNAYDLGWRAVETLAKLRLHQGRTSYLLGHAAEAKELLMSCAASAGVSLHVRATALYRLGRMRLDASDIAGATGPLEQAEALIRHAGAPKLIRRIRRSLAVTLCQREGPQRQRKEVGIDGSWEVAALSSLSVGVTICNQLTHQAARRSRKGAGSSEPRQVCAGLRLFGVVSGGGVGPHDAVTEQRCKGGRAGNEDCGAACLSEAMDSELTAEWPIVSLCLAPGEGATKHLLVTRLARGCPPVTASIPLSAEDTGLLARWRDIMDENRDTLRGHSADEAAAWGNKEKAAWWDRRAAVDTAVDTLVRELEGRWLQAHGLAPLLSGNIVDEGLGAALESLYGYAIGRIAEVRQVSAGSVRGKSGLKGNGGARARKTATVASASQVDDMRESGIAELVRVCVRGGNVMTEAAWLALVRRALSRGSHPDAPAGEIAAEIHGRVVATFAAVAAVEGSQEVNSRCSGSTWEQNAGTASDRRVSLEIEAGRSARDSQMSGKAQAIATSAASRTSEKGPSIDKNTLSKMKVADIKRELSSRGVAVTGLKLKSDLLSRLTEAIRLEANTPSLDSVDKSGHGSMSSTGSADGLRKKPARSVSVNISDTGTVKFGQAHSKRKLRDAEIFGHDRTDASGANMEHEGFQAGVQRQPVVLVLDEQLQAIPWEALPCLRGHAVTRVPALPFVFSALAARWSGDEPRDRSNASSHDESCDTQEGTDGAWVPARDGVRLDRGCYVLDPEANLPHTQKHLGPVFEGFQRRFGWSGTKGQAPSEEAMTKTLERNDIFVYCGHGAGELLVGREAVAGLARCAVAVLMGCSSGRLKGYGDFEPSGMVSSYLVGGSPAVVANLWDVTDRDIDRFSMSLLNLFVGEGGEEKRASTLAHAVAEARSECKMAFIIGHAPVCYGVPVAVVEA